MSDHRDKRRRSTVGVGGRTTSQGVVVDRGRSASNPAHHGHRDFATRIDVPFIGSVQRGSRAREDERQRGLEKRGDRNQPILCEASGARSCRLRPTGAVMGSGMLLDRMPPHAERRCDACDRQDCQTLVMSELSDAPREARCRRSCVEPRACRSAGHATPRDRPPPWLPDHEEHPGSGGRRKPANPLRRLH